MNKLKMKVIVVSFSIFTLVLSRSFTVSKLLWIFVFPAIFCAATTYLNKYKRGISYYNDFPNVLRLFFGCLGGVLLESYDILAVTSGLLSVLLGVFINDEEVRRVYRNKGVIILSGIDGTGKSTHAKRIYEWLKQKGISSRIVPFHQYVFLDKLSRFRLRLWGKKRQGSQRKMPSGWVPAKTTKFSFIRPYLAFIDNLLFYLIKIVPCVRRGEYVICDRFIWDNYIKHKALGYNTRFLFKLSSLIKPQTGMVLDLPAEIAFERVERREKHLRYTIEQYEIERKEFKRIAKMLNYPVIETNELIQQTWNRIEAYLASFIREAKR